MSFFIAKWYLYTTFYHQTGKWPSKGWRRWVKQTLTMQIQREKLAAHGRNDDPA